MANSPSVKPKRIKHLWKIRREGYRDLMISKKWTLRGAYAEKRIGQHWYMQRTVQVFPDYNLVLFECKDDFWKDILKKDKL